MFVEKNLPNIPETNIKKAPETTAVDSDGFPLGGEKTASSQVNTNSLLVSWSENSEF